MNTYFHNIVNGIQTVFEGMSISLASMFLTPCTVQYPDDDISSDEALAKTYKGQLRAMSDNYRGVLDVDLSICTACTLCVKACPIECIAIDAVKCDKSKVKGTKGEKEAVKTRTPTRFDIHVGKCMFCGLCAQACPTGAVHHTKVFELNKHTLDELVLRFVSEEEKEKAIARDKELAAEAAAKKKAKAEADAAKKAAEQKEDKTAEEPKKEKEAKK